MTWSCWDEIVVGIITPDFSCEAEISCSVKLAKTKGKVVGCLTISGGLTSLFDIGSESVDGAGRGDVGVFNRLESLFLQSLKSVERLMYNNTNIIAKMRFHCIAPPISPKMPWNMFPIPVVQYLTACPVDSIILDAASPSLLTTFSSRSPTPFKVSWIAPPIALIIDLPPCVTYSRVAPRALPMPSKVSPSPWSTWRSFNSCIASWTSEKISSIV